MTIKVDSVKGFISNSKILIMTVEEIHEAQRCPQEPPEDSSIDASQKKQVFFRINRSVHKSYCKNNFQNFRSSGFHERLLDLLNPDQRENGLRLWQQLKFFFMNPLDKYRTRQKIPFKIFVEALKVAFVTTQLILFARLRISHVDFLDETLTVMRHKFLKEWGDERDTHTYPPTSGRYSIYNGDQIIQHFAHIITTYYSIQEDSFTAYSYDLSVAYAHYNGSWNEELDKKHIKGKLHSLQQHIAFDSIPPLQICINRITDVKIVDQIYVFDNREKNECFLLNFTRKEVDDVVSRPHVLSALLVQRDIAFHADDSLIICKTTFNFNLRSIRFSTLQNGQKPECYLIKVTIGFDNSRHTGLVRVDLATSISFIDSCFGQILKVNSYGFDTVAVAVIDLIVMCMCLGSFFLSLRALIRGHLLKNATRSFFDHAFGIQLSVQDQWEFFSPWHAMIVVNDFLLIVGTVSKLFIQFRDFDSELLSFTGVLLGLGVLLVFFGLQRYFTFFSQYNIIILTLRKSLPSILRYLVCAVILYSGFLFAGWVIIGPYSLKFRTLAESSETLFSLLNGDDMFATFYMLSDDNIIVKVFGTVYIYLFISLFIYVVLSLFIAIILDAYEVVKNRLQKKTHLKNSALREFMGSSKMAELDSHELRVENQHFARLDWYLQVLLILGLIAHR